MSIEKDEQIVQEIVTQVMNASIEDNQNIEFKLDSSLNDDHLTPNDYTPKEDPVNISTHTAISFEPEIEEQPRLPKEEQQLDNFVLECKEDVPEIGISTSEVNKSNEDDVEDGVKQVVEYETSNSHSVNKSHSQIDTSVHQVSDISVMNSSKLTEEANHDDDELLDGHDECKKEIEDNTAKDLFDRNIAGTGNIENKEFEPLTPPIFGNPSFQEEHQLHQHEQQQQLFNATSITETKLTDSGEESDFPNNSGQQANGNDIDSGKANGTSNGPQGKVEPKTKTKLCTIL